MTRLKMTMAALAALSQGDIANALVTSTPGGIEAQEARGQATLIANEYLPIEMYGISRDELTAMGFEFGESLDELFIRCKLPPGWKKVATSHSMHSDLVDDRGVIRAGIFYKAAFYDRRADMTWVQEKK